MLANTDALGITDGEGTQIADNWVVRAGWLVSISIKVAMVVADEAARRVCIISIIRIPQSLEVSFVDPSCMEPSPSGTVCRAQGLMIDS